MLHLKMPMRSFLCALAAAGLAAGSGCSRKPEVAIAAAAPEPPAAATAATPATAPAPPETSAAAAPFDRLLGRWQRSDADYVIEVVKANADGTVEANYFNPRPIHVSQAVWKAHEGRAVLFVELTDRNYPGNYYELVYDAGSDALLGRYNHLGTREVFDVAFSRIAGPRP